MRNDTLQKESGYKKKEVSGPSKSHGSLQADNCTMARACKELGKRKKNLKSEHTKYTAGH
jgi:hypothetical protein